MYIVFQMVFSFPDKGDREFSQYSYAVHYSNNGESMKKPYMKPGLIDLSIEGMTGIGAGIMASSCNEGIGYALAPSSCDTNGALASSSCRSGFLQDLHAVVEMLRQYPVCCVIPGEMPKMSVSLELLLQDQKVYA
jgi:hypothetical protein